MAIMKLFLVLYNKETKRRFTKYFENEKQIDNFIKKLNYSKKLFIIEDSRDIKFN